MVCPVFHHNSNSDQLNLTNNRYAKIMRSKLCAVCLTGHSVVFGTSSALFVLATQLDRIFFLNYPNGSEIDFKSRLAMIEVIITRGINHRHRPLPNLKSWPLYFSQAMSNTLAIYRFVEYTIFWSMSHIIFFPSEELVFQSALISDSIEMPNILF